jgi:hypothetical protein
MISSTSHSSSLSSNLGGGSRKFGPYLSVSLYGVSNLVWNALWIFQCEGNLRQYVMSEIFLVIGKGLYLLGASFVDLYGSGRFVCLSQTESPTLNGLKLVSLARHCCDVLMASWAS